VIKKILNIYQDAFSGLSREIWLLSLIMLINRAGAMVLPFMTLYLNKSLHFSLTDAGVVMASFGIGSILGAYIGGELSDKYGAYPIQLFSLLSSAVLLIGFVFIRDYYLIIVTVFVYALITDSLRPANSVSTAAYSTEENRARSYSLMRFAANLGFAIGPAIGGITAGTIGYKWIFVIDACSCLAAAYVLVKFLSGSRHKTAPKLQLKHEIQPVKSKSAYQDGEYLFFIFLVALYGITFFQLFASVPMYWAKDWHYSETTIGILLACNGLFIVLFEMPYMRRVEWIKNYWVMMTLGSLMLILGYLFILTSSTSILFALGFIIFMSLSEMFAMPFMTNFAINRPAPDRRGQYMALYTMAYGVAHTVAPMSALFLAEKIGFQYTYMIMMGVAAFIMFVFYIKAQKVKKKVRTAE
jgi:predicted MFS family arabinose efflux permease